MRVENLHSELGPCICRLGPGSYPGKKAGLIREGLLVGIVAGLTLKLAEGIRVLCFSYPAEEDFAENSNTPAHANGGQRFGSLDSSVYEVPDVTFGYSQENSYLLYSKNLSVYH